MIAFLFAGNDDDFEENVIAFPFCRDFEDGFKEMISFCKDFEENASRQP